MLVSVISSISKHWRDLRIKDLPVTPASDPWSSESSGSFVTLQLIPGQSWFDWGESLDPGLGSEEFLRPLVNPTPAEKKVLSCSQAPLFSFHSKTASLRLNEFSVCCFRLS